MQIVEHAEEINSAESAKCVAIGVFDGVHLGHQQILSETIANATRHGGLSVAVTFDRHPSAIVAPQHTPRLIYSLRKRLKVIETLGADAAIVIRFDEAFSQKSGEKFIRDLAKGLGRVRSVCVGQDFTFGHKRGGNLATLESLGEELNFSVSGLSSVSLNGSSISSTRIRELLRGGEFSRAKQMLGRDYSLSAPVVTGDGIGRKLGYPTANLNTTGLELPPNGVYAARAEINNSDYQVVMNIGCRPSLQEKHSQIRVEAHLLDFSGDLYDQEIELTFVEKLRDEETFPNLDALKAQIATDTSKARLILG